MLNPGNTIGILGGGQLGRMLAMAGTQLGYRIVGYAPPGDNVARCVCDDFFENKWDDSAALAAFAAQCDAVTWEFENVPLTALEPIPVDRLAPSRRALEVAQDRLNEKNFVNDLGGRTAAFSRIDSRYDLPAAIDRLGAPGILKTRRDGYDGKGQWRIGSRHEADALNVPDKPLIYEEFVEFDSEFSVIVVRTRAGEVRFWDSPVNAHEDGILRRSTVPAPGDLAPQVEKARELARDAADALGYVGVLTLEFFATASGPIFNEMAPRVHNSGHWTIEGAVTSQFANHMRAVAGLPLGDCATRGARVTMDNLIGREIEQGAQILTDPSASLHVYGKGAVREGRKMGHVTRVHSG